jgi:hypothetical protein
MLHAVPHVPPCEQVLGGRVHGGQPATHGALPPVYDDDGQAGIKRAQLW